MMRVAHVITGLNTGGAEMMLSRLAQRLVSRTEQRVYSLTDLGPVTKTLTEAGVAVESLGMSVTRPNPLKVAALSWRLRRFKPDVVQTWLYHADLLGGVAARMAGLRTVAWNIRNSDLSPERTSARTLRVVHLLARLSRTLPACIVSCSQAAVESHVAAGYARERFRVIPNGFDFTKFKPDREARTRVRRELGIGEDVPLIGLFARFDPQKNHDGFVAAAGLLHRQRADAHFVLAGRGIDRSNTELREWIRAAGVGQVMHLLGERGDMPELNAALDIASLASKGEAFPNALGEAMACGVPCVSTDAGDAALILGDTGVIVPRDRTDLLLQAWLRMLDLPPQERFRMGSAAQARVMSLFDLDAIARRYEELFHELASRR